MEKFALRKRVRIDGVMPERALLRLKRAGIAVYNVKKTQKTQIVLDVKKKDIEKVFAIYPNVCYNSSTGGAYTATDMGGVGLLKGVSWAKQRMGLLLGGAAFCLLTAIADAWTLGIEVNGTDAYTRDVRAILAQHGVRVGARYAEEDTDAICAELLKLDGVEYCSVKKTGFRVVVELRLAEFDRPTLEKGDMTAKRSGTILSATAMRGTLLKGAGARVEAGETLVGGYFLTESGEHRAVEPIARVKLACEYSGAFAAESEEAAFAAAYLELALGEKDEIVQKEIVEKDGAYIVRIGYTVIETVNL